MRMKMAADRVKCVSSVFSSFLCLASVVFHAAGCDPEPTCQELQNCPVPGGNTGNGGAAGRDGSGTTGGAGSAITTGHFDGSGGSQASGGTMPDGGGDSNGSAGSMGGMGGTGEPTEAGPDVFRDAPMPEKEADAFRDTLPEVRGPDDAPPDVSAADVRPESSSNSNNFVANLDPANELPPSGSNRTATVRLVLALDGNGNTFGTYTLTLSSYTGMDAGDGSNTMLYADFIVGSPGDFNGTPFETVALTSRVSTGTIMTIAPRLGSLRSGAVYVNVRNNAYPTGEMRGWFMAE
jgi:hypothetical protein